MSIAQNESSQQSLSPRYKYSDKQIQLAVDIKCGLKGAFLDLYKGAQKVLSDKEDPKVENIQQALYIATVLMGASTQYYLNLFPCYWYISIGESGGGKTFTNLIISNTLSKIETQNRCWPIKMPGSREGLYRRLDSTRDDSVPNPNVFVYWDEGLAGLKRIWPYGDVENISPTGPLVETLLGSYGGCEELAEISTKDPEKSCKRIVNPRILFTINGQPNVYTAILNSNNFLGNGLYHRCHVFDFIGDDLPETLDGFLQGIDDKINTPTSLHSDYLSSINKILKDIDKPIVWAKKGNVPKPDYDFLNDYRELLTYLNENSLDNHALAISEQYKNRTRKRFSTYAWLHAFGCGRDKLAKEDTNFASLSLGLHYQNILNRVKTRSKNDCGELDLIEYVYEKIKNYFDKKRTGPEREYILNLVRKKWSTKFKIQDTDKALEFLIKSEYISAYNTKNKPFYRPTSAIFNLEKQ
jgi:hypothetical protein